jgi:hypothetical protein
MTWAAIVLKEDKEGSPDLLNSAIDRIAGFEASPTSAGAVASSMTATEIREAAIIHLSGLLEAEPDSVTLEHISVGGLQLKLLPTKEVDAPIRYKDVDAGFLVEGANIVRRDGPTSLSALLSLCLYVRDRSDTLLYLPKDMRAERIACLAKSTSASERFIRYLMASYHSLTAHTVT